MRVGAWPLVDRARHALVHEGWEMRAAVTPPHEKPACRALTIGALVLLPAISGALLCQRRLLVRLLRERNEYLGRVRELNAVEADLEERVCTLGQRLSLISVHAGALELSTQRNAPEVSGQAELLRTTTAAALSDLREILDVLRKPISDGPEHPGRRSGTRAGLAAGADLPSHPSGADDSGTGAPSVGGRSV